jgi:hypothetical protein
MNSVNCPETEHIICQRANSTEKDSTVPKSALRVGCAPWPFTSQPMIS